MYETLGVVRDASQSEIRKAYRKRALQYHPDKNAGDAQAELLFHRVAVAYRVLSDPSSRARYDRGEGTGTAELYRGFSSRALFNQHFGEALMEWWRPGLLVSGLLVASGTRLSITIHPDGLMDEEEHAERVMDRLFSYTSMSITNVGGGRTHCMTFATRVGQALAEVVVPVALVARRPRLGVLATAVVSWVPALVALAACVFVATPRRRVPGQLPESLAVALRQASLRSDAG